MTSKRNPMQILDKLPLSKMSILFFRGSFKVLCRQVML